MNETMNGLDVESVLAAHQRDYEHRVNADNAELRDVGASCSCGRWNAFDHPGHHDAHVAAVLREQITAAQAEAWERGHEVCEWPGCIKNHPNPYRAALVAPSREEE